MGLIDTGVDMSIITPESWHPNWPLQEADVQFIGTGTPISSETKHKMGLMHRARRLERKAEVLCSKYCSEFMGSL